MPADGAAAARLAGQLGGEVARLLRCTAAPAAATTAAAAVDLRAALLEARLALALPLTRTPTPTPSPYSFLEPSP